MGNGLAVHPHLGHRIGVKEELELFFQGLADD